MSHTHAHDGPHSHAHDHSHDHVSAVAAEHGHTHEIYNGPGSYLGREMPIVEGRDWRERAFTIGIGGLVCHASFIILAFITSVLYQSPVMTCQGPMVAEHTDVHVVQAIDRQQSCLVQSLTETDR